MADMLVKLYEIPPLQPALDAIANQKIRIRPARPGEERVISRWVERRFNESWSGCVQFGIYRNPCSLFVAVEREPADPMRTNPYDLPPEHLVGFACYDSSNRGMFGPMGVVPEYESRGIGKALLLTALHAMWTENYAYAVIGWAGPVEWYGRTVGASLIPGSEPGPFRGELHEKGGGSRNGTVEKSADR